MSSKCIPFFPKAEVGVQFPGEGAVVQKHALKYISALMQVLPLLVTMAHEFLHVSCSQPIKSGQVHPHSSKAVDRVKWIDANVFWTVPGKEQSLHQGVPFLVWLNSTSQPATSTAPAPMGAQPCISSPCSQQVCLKSQFFSSFMGCAIKNTSPFSALAQFPHSAHRGEVQRSDSSTCP
jgi:hypothetical protein